MPSGPVWCPPTTLLTLFHLAPMCFTWHRCEWPFHAERSRLVPADNFVNFVSPGTDGVYSTPIDLAPMRAGNRPGLLDTIIDTHQGSITGIFLNR